MSTLTKNILWAVLTLIVVSLLFSFFVSPSPSPANLSLNDLANKINAGQITKIVVNGDDLAITQKDGTAAVFSQKRNRTGDLGDAQKFRRITPRRSGRWILRCRTSRDGNSGPASCSPRFSRSSQSESSSRLMFQSQAKTGVNQAFDFWPFQSAPFHFLRIKCFLKTWRGSKRGKGRAH